MVLDGLIDPASPRDDALVDAVEWFEAAALGGHTFAMYNLGVAHLYGYGMDVRDPDVAAEWFEACGLPEGMAAVAMHREGAGRRSEAKQFHARASRLGFGSEWRAKARLHTGSGGVGHVELHSNWERHVAAVVPVPPRW